MLVHLKMVNIDLEQSTTVTAILLFNSIFSGREEGPLLLPEPAE